MSIKNRLQLILYISILLSALILFLILDTRQRVDSGFIESALFYEVTTQVMALNLVSDMYLRDPSARARIQWDSVYASLGALLGRLSPVRPDEQRVVRSLQENYHEVHAIFSRLVDSGMGSSEEDLLYATARKRLPSQLSVKLRVMVDEVALLLDGSQQRIRSAEQQAGMLMVILVLIMVSISALLLFFLSRGISTALERLSEGAKRVAGGDLDFRIQIDEIDELSLFARDFNDMTDHLKASYAKVEQEIAERTRVEKELRAYAVKLEQSNRDLRDFAFIASHDLQEPLRKIRTFGDRLRLKHGEALGRDGREDLERMQLAAERSQELIQALFSHYWVASRTEPFRPVDLQSVVADLVAGMAEEARKVQARFEIGGLPVIEGDATQIRELFRHLIANALKFRGREPPRISIYSRSPLQEHSRKPGAECYEICVEDNGIGFDEKYLPLIFTPFQRLHGRDAYEGTGMGLAICRKIVEHHGGSITARSTPGQGTMFVLRLPAQSIGGEGSAK